MSFLENLGRRVRSVLTRTGDWMDRDPATRAIKESWEGGQTAAGIAVNARTAMNYSAVWAAVQVISSAVASLPVKVYRRKDEGREEIVSGDLTWLLREEPSKEMSPYTFKETMLAHVLLTGNAFAEIVRAESGRLSSLEILVPSDVKVERNAKGALVYTYKGKTLAASDVLHVPGLGFDGLVGYSPITMARESIALGLAVEKFGSSWFGNGAWPGIVARHPKTLSDEAYGRIREGWNQTHKGAGKAHKLAILEEGMEIDRVGVSPEDSQFLETRQFQVVEIARWFNVSPTKLRDLGRATWSNIEAENIDFVVSTLRPWLVRFEQEITRKLVAERDRGLVYAEFKVDALLRGDTKTRFEAYAVGRQWGWYSANDIRKMENLEPIGKDGDVYLVPSNMMAAEQVLDPPEPAPAPAPASPDGEEPKEPEAEEPKPEPKRAALAIAHRSVLTDALGRMVRAEANAARKAATKPSVLMSWAESFYATHAQRMSQSLLPAVSAHLALIGSDEDPATRTAAIVKAHVARSLGDLAHASDAETIEETVSRWEIERPAELADAFQKEALRA